VQTDRKRIYVFGSSASGALGLSSLLRPNHRVQKKVTEFLARPVRNLFGGLEEIQDMAVGHGFSLIKTKARRGLEGAPTLFGSGLNTHSQLGYQAARVDAPLQILISFAPITLSSSFRTVNNILALGAGRAHSVVSLAGEGLVTFGDNSSGQCGRLNIRDEEYFGSRLMYRIAPFGSGPEHDVLSIVSRFDLT
jgi:alpha-tubulin suppressor-like RCC1 family protein